MASISQRRGLMRDIFISAKRDPNMVPKKTVITERSSVIETPLIRKTSQYWTRIFHILAVIVEKDKDLSLH